MRTCSTGATSRAPARDWTCHGDGEFADAIAPFLPIGPTYRLPQAFVVEDVVAAIAHSRGFVGSSLHGSITAFVFDMPFSILNLSGYTKLAAFAAMAGSEPRSSLSDRSQSIPRARPGWREGAK